MKTLNFRLTTKRSAALIILQCKHFLKLPGVNPQSLHSFFLRTQDTIKLLSENFLRYMGRFSPSLFKYSSSHKTNA